jgi:hypothetical protein
MAAATPRSPKAFVSTYRDYLQIERLSDKAVAYEGGAGKADVEWIQNYGRGIMAGLVGYLASLAFLSALYYDHMWFAVSLMVSLRVIAARLIGVDGRSIALAGEKR